MLLNYSVTYIYIVRTVLWKYKGVYMDHETTDFSIETVEVDVFLDGYDVPEGVYDGGVEADWRHHQVLRDWYRDCIQTQYQ